MIPIWLLQWLGTLLGGAALLWLGWTRKDRKDWQAGVEGRIGRLEGQQTEMRLMIAQELPTKKDMHDINRWLESMDSTMGELREMVVRLEERSKIHGTSTGH